MPVEQKTQQEYLDILNKYRDNNKKEECVVLSCGPSLNLFSEEQIRDFCKNKLVIAIKLAYLKYKDVADVMMANGCNLPYSTTGEFYNVQDVFSIFSANFPKSVELKNQECDIYLQVTNPFYNGAGQDQFVCFTQNFEQEKLGNTLFRKCYPGIMGESCIPFVEFMGFKRFYTIGWDLINAQVSIDNYKHSWADNTKLTNPANPGALPWDNIANIQASAPLNDWLASKGIEWNIIGNSALSDKIKRVDL